MDQYVLSLSYGKDSLACLGAIKELGWPLDRIVHASVWATDDIPADLPPMVEFKSKADEWIKEHFGIEVEHVFATKRERERRTYESVLYEQHTRGKHIGELRGFPMQRGPWCNDRLKTSVLDGIRKINVREDILPPASAAEGGVSDLRIPNHQGSVVQRISQERCPQEITGFPTRWTQYCTGELKKDILRKSLGFQSQSREGTGAQLSKHEFSNSALKRGADINIVQYLGIASDEPERIARHTKPGFLLPLVEAGWDEAYCRKWCEERDLLSPIYTTATRGGCWFCHNQGVDQLRLLRKNYPDLWALLMKWDLDSPVTFHADGHTVHDFDRRFQYEDDGKIPTDRRFRWKMLEQLNSENCSE